MAAYMYDLFVIGGGSGGVRGSRMAASYGAKVRALRQPRLSSCRSCPTARVATADAPSVSVPHFVLSGRPLRAALQHRVIGHAGRHGWHVRHPWVCPEEAARLRQRVQPHLPRRRRVGVGHPVRPHAR